jgi:alkanesulfonate monooxygenase SsuD/methylene tetrahydromethanopterin reductase-like flavin-dependent oxidoreductase (luciferase family)
VKRALFLPPFDDLADPRLLAELAAEAERAGWDGLFLWDHVMRPDPPRPVADPWIALAAVAVATERIRLGPMITPIVRRRPQKLAREVATLDHLSRGRVTLGMGLGVDTGRELSAFGEVTDTVERGDVLDEGLDLLRALLSGEPVHHHGRYFTADSVTFLPPPVQRPVPIWMAARSTKGRPLRRAARAEGLFPIEVTPDEVASMLAVVAEERGSLDGFEVVALASSGPSQGEWAAAGATWWFADLEPGATAVDVRDLIHR